MAMWIYCPRTPNFNSRPSARGDLFPMTLTEVPILFQFTPLREGRLGSVWDGVSEAVFQFTPLREGRHRLIA